MTMNCSFDQATGTLSAAFHARMDTVNSAGAHEEFARESTRIGPAATRRIVFDLAGVDYVASGFLRLCLSAAKSVPSGGFSIVNTDPGVKKVFKIAGLDELLQVS